MYKKISVIFLLLTSQLALAQLSIKKFNPKITFTAPDPLVWHLVKDEAPHDNYKGILMYKHIPIVDGQRRQIEPVIGITYEMLDQDLDCVEYSVGMLGEKSLKIHHTLLGGYPKYSLDKNSTVFSASYVREGVSHKLYMGYIVNKRLGIEVTCDATSDIFNQVDFDMKKFLRSVYIKN